MIARIKNTILMLFLLFAFSPILSFSTSYINSNSRLISLAGAGGVHENIEIVSLHYNPALLNINNNNFINMNYTQYNNIAELAQSSISLIYPCKNLKISTGFQYENQNFNNFNQELLILSGASKISNLHIGCNLKRYEISYPDAVSSISSYGADIGFFYPINKISFYLITRNIGVKEIDPSSLKNSSLGISLYPLRSMSTNESLIGDKIQINFDYYIEENEKEFIFSQESYLLSWLCLRYGIQSYSHRYGIGIGTNLMSMKFDYGILTHPMLTPTHSISFSYNF